MKTFYFLLLVIYSGNALAQYAPQAGLPGSTAISAGSSLFAGWATQCTVQRGYKDIASPGSGFATLGDSSNAAGPADGTLVSLGDSGVATLTFNHTIYNGPGPDFAVFENGFPNAADPSQAFLELAFVEVSSDGVNFFRFPNHSETQTQTQIGSFGSPVATYLNNLAGKYAGQYGTPFDISEIADNDLLDKNHITHVKVIDVVGTINPDFASYDSQGNAVNDSFPTPFASCGFDLQAVGVINSEVLGLPVYNTAPLKMYPNPAKDLLNLKSDLALDITIYDMAGRAVFSQKNNVNHTINVSHLSAGSYSVVAISGSFSQRLPLIISK